MEYRQSQFRAEHLGPICRQETLFGQRGLLEAQGMGRDWRGIQLECHRAFLRRTAGSI